MTEQPLTEERIRALLSCPRFMQMYAAYERLSCSVCNKCVYWTVVRVMFSNVEKIVSPKTYSGTEAKTRGGGHRGTRAPENHSPSGNKKVQCQRLGLLAVLRGELVQASQVVSVDCRLVARE